MILSYFKVFPVFYILSNIHLKALVSLLDSLTQVKVLGHLYIVHFELLVKLKVPHVVQHHPLHPLFRDHVHSLDPLLLTLVGVSPPPETRAHVILVVSVLDYRGFESVYLFLPDLQLPGPKHLVQAHS